MNCYSRKSLQHLSVSALETPRWWQWVVSMSFSPVLCLPGPYSELPSLFMTVIVFNHVIGLVLHGGTSGEVTHHPGIPAALRTEGTLYPSTPITHLRPNCWDMLLCVNLDFSHLPFNPKEFHKKIRMVAVFQWNADPLHSFMWHCTTCQDWGGEWPQLWKGSLCLWRKRITYSVSVFLEWWFLALCWFLLWTSFLFWIAL